jgi:hypothetical protein
LVAQHRAAPGRGVDLTALQEIAWPGERMAANAAKNRIQVALAYLRSRGLKAHLVRQGDGYVLDPSLSVQHVAASFREAAALYRGRIKRD